MGCGAVEDGGLPILVKYLEDAEGLPTARGTRAYRSRPPAAHDSVHVARLRAAGALVIGKTNTPPLGAAVHTTNDAFGTTHNPWNPARTPGGSSGGAAAAVAAGLVALATAGDGGASTSIPAVLCGVIGLKPSRGRIPHGPSRMPVWPQHACLSAWSARYGTPHCTSTWPPATTPPTRTHCPHPASRTATPSTSRCPSCASASCAPSVSRHPAPRFCAPSTTGRPTSSTGTTSCSCR
ncbi:amidase family protein [Streptomyces wedmorensis]|uniref:amidase family protein n=1 Tax=Streptomyces wedmorensis TaxID=43759 RepID=UPI003F4D3C42